MNKQRLTALKAVALKHCNNKNTFGVTRTSPYAVGLPRYILNRCKINCEFISQMSVLFCCGFNIDIFE